MVRKRLPKTLRPNDVETLVLSSPLLIPLFSCFIFACSEILEADCSPISRCLWLLYRVIPQINLTLQKLAFTAVGIFSSFSHWFPTAFTPAVLIQVYLHSEYLRCPQPLVER